jgi:tetratricopeptide (TPR) repeat protein
VISRNCNFSIVLSLILIRAAFSQPKPAYDLKKCEAAPSISFAQAEQRAVVKGTVDIPPLAKQLRLQGTVRIEICVSEAGDVVLTKPVNGHPILIPAATDSAKKWRFKPEEAGPFKTILEIPFSQGDTKAQIADEQKINEQFFAEEGKCRESVRANSLDDALKRCKEAVDLAEKLPKERANERRGAYQLVGHAFFGQRKYEDALGYYRTELEIALSSLQPDEAELAYAYHDVALAFHTLGRQSEAAQNYVKAEQTILLARDHISLEDLKPRYTATLKQIREHYLILLQQTGQTAAAADLEKRIQSERK